MPKAIAPSAETSTTQNAALAQRVALRASVSCSSWLSRKLLRGFVLFAKPTFDIRTSGIPPISKTKRYASALPKAHVKAGQQRADVFRATPLQLFKRTRIMVHFVFLD